MSSCITIDTRPPQENDDILIIKMGLTCELQAFPVNKRRAYGDWWSKVIFLSSEVIGKGLIIGTHSFLELDPGHDP